VKKLSRGEGRVRHDKGLRLPIRSAGSMTGLLNAGVLDSRTVIVMNHEHENDDTGLIEEGGKSSFQLAWPLREILEPRPI